MRQRTDMEMLDGTEPKVVRVVGAPEAGPVVVDGMGIGADAGSVAEAGGGPVAP